MTELHLGRLEEVSVRVVPDQYLSMLALMTNSLVRRNRRVPESLGYQIRAAVSPGNIQAVRPLVEPGYSLAPDCITPTYSTLEGHIGDQLERLHDMSAEEINSDLAETFGDQMPTHWRAVSKHPQGWLRRYTNAINETWSTMRPVWRHARPLFDREIERVGTAVVRGRLDIILGTIHQRIRFENKILKIRGTEPARFELAGRPLVLVPMLSDGDVVICNFDRPDAVWLGYSMPETYRVLGETFKPNQNSSLDLLLGPVRLQIMTALTKTYTMGELAAHTNQMPSTISYHCERLMALGLVERQRQGREVRVSRTHRFEYLAELFGLSLPSVPHGK